MKLNFDCVIVGAGVAGMTSALYLKRAGLNVAIIEKNYVGGQINKTYTIQNYPGFLEIDGPTLSLNIKNQLDELKVPIIYQEVIKIESSDKLKKVITTKEEYNTKTIIIATGRKERKLNLSLEEELVGHGISYCATCDGNFFKGEEVAVVGGGNTAMEDALYLSNICPKVHLINRSSNFSKADKILYEKVKNSNNINILTDCVVDTLEQENGSLSGVILNNKQKLNIKGLFIAIGSVPDIEFLKSLELATDNNYIIVDEHMETSISGIFACGDIIKKDLYQIITAASEGAIAANSVKKNLLER